MEKWGKENKIQRAWWQVPAIPWSQVQGQPHKQEIWGHKDTLSQENTKMEEKQRQRNLDSVPELSL